MSCYVYIAAWQWEPDEPIGFTHCLLEAEDEEEAYDRGFEQVRREEGAGLVNDYVIELDSVAEEE